MAGESSFDVDEVFDDDYLYFYEPHRTSERSDADADLVARLLGLEPGTSVLDVACGTGRIANRLATRGCAVTGLDRSARFLELARADAAQRGLSVDYVRGDVRSLPWRGRFDAALCWFTSWGYFDDEENRNALAELHTALKQGGKLALEHLHRDNLVRRFQRASVEERDGDYMVDRHRFDPTTGRIHTDRVVVRANRVRRFSFFVRLPSYSELRDWLLAAGFGDVQPYGDGGTPLTLESRRLIAVATK